MWYRRKVQLEAISHREDVDVCCLLQEFNLGPEADTSKFAGFTVLRQDRRYGRDGNPARGTRGDLGAEGIQFEELRAPVAVPSQTPHAVCGRQRLPATGASCVARRPR